MKGKISNLMQCIFMWIWMKVYLFALFFINFLKSELNFFDYCPLYLFFICSISQCVWPWIFFLQAPSGKDGLSPECDHDSSFGSMSARSSTTDSASPLSEYRGLISSQVALSSRTDSNSPVSDYHGLSRRTDSQVWLFAIYLR